ncbi:MAG: hypothetical protein DCC49_06695 [Acidobacteria bacterium]|nr:MAG: hypothetical protein DCC49_06695 [Acidobacteriota bacterium]
MDCEKFAAVVYEYLDSEIAYEVKIEIHEHLSRCPGCDSAVEFERRMKVLIAKACQCGDCPEGLEERVLRALQEASEA